MDEVPDIGVDGEIDEFVARRNARKANDFVFYAQACCQFEGEPAMRGKGSSITELYGCSEDIMIGGIYEIVESVGGILIDIS